MRVRMRVLGVGARGRERSGGAALVAAASASSTAAAPLGASVAPGSVESLLWAAPALAAVGLALRAMGAKLGHVVAL